jgi:hypothetical protein
MNYENVLMKKLKIRQLLHLLTGFVLASSDHDYVKKLSEHLHILIRRIIKQLFFTKITSNLKFTVF